MMIEIISIITLALLVIAQAVERYFFAKHMTEELSKCIKAVMSRNINEYIAATEVDKGKKEDFAENDEVDMADLPDDEFLKAIQPK